MGWKVDLCICFIINYSNYKNGVFLNYTVNMRTKQLPCLKYLIMREGGNRICFYFVLLSFVTAVFASLEKAASIVLIKA